MMDRPAVPRVATPRADSDESLEWVCYEDEPGNRTFFNELGDVVKDPVHIDGIWEAPDEYLLEMRISEIQNLMSRATRGSLKSPNPEGWNEWGHTGSNPSMWEIRHTWSTKRHVRLYHGEPPKEPLTLIACGCQIKVISGDSEAMQTEQTDAIHTATARHQRHTSGL